MHQDPLITNTEQMFERPEISPLPLLSFDGMDERMKTLSAALQGAPYYRLGVEIGKHNNETPPSLTQVLQYDVLVGVVLSLLPKVQNQPASHVKDIAARLVEEQVALGISIAEIGGVVMPPILQGLGATGALADGGVRKEGRIANDMSQFGDFEGLVFLDAYEHKFPSRYSLTLSNSLLETGSGMEQILPGLSAAELYLLDLKDTHTNRKLTRSAVAAMEMLAIFSNITERGGYSVHCGYNVDLPDEFIQYLGFNKVFSKALPDGLPHLPPNSRPPQSHLLILQKGIPDAAQYPEGINIGVKRIRFDAERDRFVT